MSRDTKKTAARNKKLVKPKKQTVTEEFWDYSEVKNYINQKYKVDIDNFAGTRYTGKDDDPPYQCFWHWVTDSQDVHNGCYIYLNVGEIIETEEEEEWVKKIMQMFLDEFGEEEMRCWVSW